MKEIKEAKAIVSKIKINIEKRVKYGEKDTTEIKSEDEEIFLGFDSDSEAVPLKNSQVVVEDLLQKEEEAIKKVNKDTMYDH